MEQPIRMKNNGQINIVLNNTKKKTTIIETPPEAFVHHLQEHELLREIEEELSALVGMDEMKKIIKQIYAWIHVNKKREEKGLKASKQVLHMLFKGNPGTGKTSVARIIGKLFERMEVLSKGHLIEAERADVVGEYIGQTAQKTRDLVKKAMGGILFIDEAYSLGRGGEKDFGKECIDTLVKHMEDSGNNFVLILAGYSSEMERFLNLNPGLVSRFPVIIEFPDYNVDQLMEIADKMLVEKEYVLSIDAERKIRNHLIWLKAIMTPKNFSNGRYIRNMIEKAIRVQAMRILQNNTYEKNELQLLKASDFEFEEDK